MHKSKKWPAKGNATAAGTGWSIHIHRLPEVYAAVMENVQKATSLSSAGAVPCSTWTGLKDMYGKPTVYVKGQFYQPHRVVYEHHCGPLKSDDWVYRNHKQCVEIQCMTPEHMSSSSRNADGTRTRHGPVKSIDPGTVKLAPVMARPELVLPKRPPGH